jgi:hypothetical protein
MAELMSVDLLLEGIQYGGGDKLILLLINEIADHIEADDLLESEVKSIIDVMFQQLSDNEDGDRSILNLCLVVLSNLTVPEKNAQIFCDHTITSSIQMDSNTPPEGNEGLTSMIKLCLQHNPQSEETGLNYYPKTGFSSDMIAHDPYAYATSILTNIVRIDVGKKLLLRQTLGYIPLLVKQIRSKNPIRRRGAVSTIRTILWDKEIHWWMIHEIKLLHELMLPLVTHIGAYGGEVGDKEYALLEEFTADEKKGMNPLWWLASQDPKHNYESEIDILIMILECLVLLCQQRIIRYDLYKAKIYPVIRNLDLAQSNEIVNNLINEVVNFLYRDEEGEEGLEKGSAMKSDQLALPSSVSVATAASNVDTSSDVSANEGTAEVPPDEDTDLGLD